MKFLLFILINSCIELSVEYFLKRKSENVKERSILRVGILDEFHAFFE